MGVRARRTDYILGRDATCDGKRVDEGKKKVYETSPAECWVGEVSSKRNVGINIVIRFRVACYRRACFAACSWLIEV